MVKLYRIAVNPTQIILNSKGIEFFRHSGYISSDKLEKEITLPDELLKEYLNCDELKEFKSGKVGIYSIKLSGYKQ
jgi:hypothetical protein